MTHDSSGRVLDVGRKTRSVPTAIRRALAARDRRCQFPACTARRCDAHHVDHWMDGGPTSLDNLILLCRRHHRLVHEGGLGLQRATDGTVSFYRPDGRLLEVAPPPPRISADHPFVPMTARLAAQHITITPRTLGVWEGGTFNLVYAIDALYRRPTANRAATEP